MLRAGGGVAKSSSGGERQANKKSQPVACLLPLLTSTLGTYMLPTYIKLNLSLYW